MFVPILTCEIFRIPCCFSFQKRSEYTIFTIILYITRSKLKLSAERPVDSGGQSTECKSTGTSDRFLREVVQSNKKKTGKSWLSHSHIHYRNLCYTCIVFVLPKWLTNIKTRTVAAFRFASGTEQRTIKAFSVDLAAMTLWTRTVASGRLHTPRSISVHISTSQTKNVKTIKS